MMATSLSLSINSSSVNGFPFVLHQNFKWSFRETILFITIDTLLLVVAGFAPIVKSIEDSNRYPGSSVVLGFTEGSFSVTCRSARAVYNCSNFCAMLTVIMFRCSALFSKPLRRLQQSLSDRV